MRGERPDTSAYWSVADVAERWGYTREIIYKYIRCGTFPTYKLGPRGIRLAREDVEAFERQNRVSNKTD